MTRRHPVLETRRDQTNDEHEGDEDEAHRKRTGFGATYYGGCRG